VIVKSRNEKAFLFLESFGAQRAGIKREFLHHYINSRTFGIYDSFNIGGFDYINLTLGEYDIKQLAYDELDESECMVHIRPD